MSDASKAALSASDAVNKTKKLVNNTADEAMGSVDDVVTKTCETASNVTPLKNKPKFCASTKSQAEPSRQSGPSHQAESLQNNQPITVEHIRVRPDRIETHIRVSDARFANTNSHIVQAVLKQYPTIGMHACRNRKGPLFSDVMNDTSTPHLLEHMIVDGQTRNATDENRVFTGTTQWSVDDPLLACVTFSYEDDIVALKVLKECLDYLNSVLNELHE